MAGKVHMYSQSFVLERTIKRISKPKFKLTNVVRKYHDVKKYKLKYEQFVPLYSIWKEYMKSAFNGTKDERLIKADYHGCLLFVAKSTNPCQIGLHGIVVRETRNTFLIITKNDRLLTISKQGCLFQFVLDSKLYTLYGDNFRFTPAGRIQKKFKNMNIDRFIDE